jgi:hypothetical protein
VTEPTTPLPQNRDESRQEGAPAKPKRRRRRGTKWLIALVVLLGLLVAADRIALAVAESQLASRIQSSQHLSEKPSVSITGFPFLTQVASRDFPHATVDIHGLTGADDLQISNLHADLHGVHVNTGFNGATVDTLVATAELSYADIAKALSSQFNLHGLQVGTVQVSYAGNDQIKAGYEVLGVAISATIDVTLSATNTLEFKSAKITTPLSAVYTPPNFDYSYDLGSLPFGMDLTKVTFTPSTVDISASGSHVNLGQSSVSTG